MVQATNIRALLGCLITTYVLGFTAPRLGRTISSRLAPLSVFYTPEAQPKRRPIIAGNWKLNPNNVADAKTLLKLISATQKCVESAQDPRSLPDVLIFPPFPFLQTALDMVSGTSIKVGAQNIGLQPDTGAYTGEVSAPMVHSLGCEYVLLGHSERRALYEETDKEINKKVLIALKAGLKVVLCVGETQDEYEMDLLQSVCEQQVKKGLKDVDIGDIAAGMVVIAYEPVWAIGTGLVATPDQAQTAHEIIRRTLGEIYTPEVARLVRIQYGGSVTPESIDELMRQPDVDGALVGGASLVPDKFNRICDFAPPLRPVDNPRVVVTAREVVTCKNTLGESPVWDSTPGKEALYWVSPPDKELWCWNLRDAPYKHILDQVVGCVALAKRQGTSPGSQAPPAGGPGRSLLLPLEQQLVLFDTHTAVSTPLVPAPEPLVCTRPNDGRVDRDGNMVFGMYNNYHRGGASVGEDNAGLWRLKAAVQPAGGLGGDEGWTGDGVVEEGKGGGQGSSPPSPQPPALENILDYQFRASNAICFSPDGAAMYFCDTPTRKLFAFDYDPNKPLSSSSTTGGRRLVYTQPSALSGGPDGANVDAEGYIWLALSGAYRVVRIHPRTGATDIVVQLPVSSPTSCTFGGADLDTLFITTRGPDGGGLYAVKMPFGIRGLPEPEAVV